VLILHGGVFSGVMFRAKPDHIKRLAVVRMMGMRLWISAYSAWLSDKAASLDGPIC
jgi:hypothetical protein